MQEQLVERLDAPQSHVSKYRAGERPLDLGEAEALASALGVALR